VVIKTTTRIGHTRADVTLGPLPPWPAEVEKGAEPGFRHDPPHWVNLPVNARRMRLEMIERLDLVERATSQLEFNRFEGPADATRVVIASGAAYGPVKEAFRELGLADRVGLVKVATPYPLPRSLIESSLEGASEVLVVEELEPFVEQAVISLVHKAGLKVRVMGKELVPLAGEITIVQAIEALATFSGTKAPETPKGTGSVGSSGSVDSPASLNKMLRPRPPTLCAGCGHRSIFYVMHVLEERKKRKGSSGFVKPSDIGCYTLGYNPPLNGVDAHLCMGGSIGMANGFATVNDMLGNDQICQGSDEAKDDTKHVPVVCTIGDSTFFHAGLPPLAHAVTTGNDLTVIILDNGTTAMTGHQPHPGAPVGREGIPIEDVVRALGVEWVRTIKTQDLAVALKTLEEAIAHPGPSVIIADSPCAVLTMRAHAKSGGLPKPYVIDHGRCSNCGFCIDRLGCPAIQRPEIDMDISSGDAGEQKKLPKPVILPLFCSACGVCGQKLVCPIGAIHPPDDGDSTSREAAR